jgi:hypothetical protein
VQVRGTVVTLERDDVDQLGLLDASSPPSSTDHEARPSRGAGAEDQEIAEAPVLYSYWRSQPCGPKSSMRRMTLVDVRRQHGS